MTENREEIVEQFMNKQDNTNKELLGNQQKIIEDQQKLLEELRLIRNEQSGRKRKQEESSTENPAKRVDLGTSKELFERTKKTGKHFVLKETFKNVSKMRRIEEELTDLEEHFGIDWHLRIRRKSEHLAFYILCENQEAERSWSIDADIEVKLLSKDGNWDVRRECYTFKPDGNETLYYGTWASKKFKTWDDMEQKFLVDDTLTFEVSIKIKNTTGIYKDDLKCFNDSKFSDIVLVVQEKKFHILKLYLATHSSYFEAMFLGMFSESTKSEIPLAGIDADDFQNYLEVLYAYDAIDEYTVEGILMVADMYDTQLVIQKCEKFLLEESEKRLKKKMEMSVKYRLDRLKEDCLSEIRTLDDIREVVTGNVRDLDPSFMADLFEKALASDE